MEPEESIPLAPGAAAARARDALLMGQAAPTTRPPGSAAALAREALQQAAPPGAAAALAREALQQRAAPPGAAAASARELLQKARPAPSAPPLPTLPPLQQHWQPPEIIDFEDDDDEDDEDYERRRCCCCFTRGHEPDDVFSRKWLKRLCFLHVVLGFALFWLLVLLGDIIFGACFDFDGVDNLNLVGSGCSSNIGTGNGTRRYPATFSSCLSSTCALSSGPSMFREPGGKGRRMEGAIDVLRTTVEATATSRGHARRCLKAPNGCHDK